MGMRTDWVAEAGGFMSTPTGSYRSVGQGCHLVTGMGSVPSGVETGDQKGV